MASYDAGVFKRGPGDEMESESKRNDAGADQKAPWIGGETAETRQCTLTLTYAVEKPEAPALVFSGAECAMHAEIAIAFALAAFLKMAGPAIPR